METPQPENQNQPQSENKEPIKQTYSQEEIDNLIGLIESQKFLSDQIKYNATMYNGFKIILEKLTRIEIQLENLNKQNGNTR